MSTCAYNGYINHRKRNLDIIYNISMLTIYRNSVTNIICDKSGARKDIKKNGPQRPDNGLSFSGKDIMNYMINKKMGPTLHSVV